MQKILKHIEIYIIHFCNTLSKTLGPKIVDPIILEEEALNCAMVEQVERSTRGVGTSSSNIQLFPKQLMWANEPNTFINEMSTHPSHNFHDLKLVVQRN